MSLALLAAAIVAGPVPVRFEPRGAGWALLRDGKPYVVRGVGGTGRMDELVALGGNSVRTWGADNGERVLDSAQRHGLTVCMGIWLGHKSYFDYGNADQVRKQLADAEAVVRRLKDHPALLFWALGNEMEIGNDTPALWKAIEEMAQMVKRIDPNHPVITVVAEVGGAKLESIRRYAPSIDAVGVNSYGGLPTLGKRIAETGWKKPYLVTEFGTLGPWERPKTPWDAPLEPTSTEKAAWLREGYEKSITGSPSCVGSYAFLWGDKQETTPTWFGLFLPETGESVQGVDELATLWTGKTPVRRAPQIAKLAWVGPNEVVAGGSLQASVQVKDPDGEAPRLRWVVRYEVAGRTYAGEGERRPDLVMGNLGSSATVRFAAPKTPGPYRLYLYAYDGDGKAATGNLPFLVK